MTRFYTSESSSTVWNRLQQIIKKLNFECRNSPDKVLHVSVHFLIKHTYVYNAQLTLIDNSFYLFIYTYVTLLICCLHIIVYMTLQVSLSVSTVDCRKQPLVFKASVYELRQDLLLVEFRRSKVCQTT